MRPTTLHSALVLLVAAQYAEAVATPMFPRAESGKGYLSIPVGTIKRPHKIGKRSAIDAILENMDFFYAIQGEFFSFLSFLSFFLFKIINPSCLLFVSDVPATSCIKQLQQLLLFIPSVRCREYSYILTPVCQYQSAWEVLPRT